MIKNVILDIGNVCVDFCYEDFFRSFGFSDDIVRRLCLASAENKVWDLGDGGAVTEEEMLTQFILQDPGIEQQMRQVYQNFNGIIREKREPSSGLKSFIRKVAKYIISQITHPRLKENVQMQWIFFHTWTVVFFPIRLN